jgi:hypothetical protein
LSFHPTLTSAREAHAVGKLADWSQAFLRGKGGNVGIANPLSRDDHVYVLAEVGLGDIYPSCGPAPDFDYPVVDLGEYERKVEAMKRALAAGWDAPPLFVHMPTLFVADGTHRREALMRLGRRNYWAVMWMTRPPLVGRGQHWGPRDDP